MAISSIGSIDCMHKKETMKRITLILKTSEVMAVRKAACLQQKI
jgi:hypothetical protein